jgi:hypothetical protein
MGWLGGTPRHPTASATGTPAFPLLPLVPGGIPTNCPGIASTAALGPLSGVVGQGAFLVSGFARSQATILLGTEMDPHIPYGWRGDLTWAAQPGFAGKVTVTGASMSGGQALWFLDRDGAGQAAVLDPQGPGTRPVTVYGQTWRTGSFTAYVPRGGCYVLRAMGPGVGWQIVFAAGNANEPVATAEPTP